MGNCVTINTNNRGVVAPMDPQGGGGTTISNNMGGDEEEEEEEISCLESLGCMLCG